METFATTVAGNPALQGARHQLYIALEKKLREICPGFNLVYSEKHSCDWLVMPLRNPRDVFLVDFSSEVADGIRCGFVVDFELGNSTRREELATYLTEAEKSRRVVSNALGVQVETRKSNGTLISLNRVAWAKVSRHQRMGIHCYWRFPEANWEDDEEVQTLADVVAARIKRFIEGMGTVLQACDYDLSSAVAVTGER
jgi:hypothetical protein